MTAAPVTQPDPIEEASAQPSLIGDAISSEWIGSWIGRQAGRARVPVDPNFSVTPDIVKELGEGIPLDYWSEFASAASMDEAKLIREQLLGLTKARQRLGDAGWVGTAARVGANILDPVGLAVGIGTGGAGWISKGGRLARMAKAGLVASATTAPVSAYIASQDPDQDWKDVVYGAAGAFLLGGVGQPIGEAIAKRWAPKVRKGIEHADAAASGGDLTPKALAAYRDEVARATPEGAAAARVADVEPEIVVPRAPDDSDDLTALRDFAGSKDIVLWQPPKDTDPPRALTTVPVPHQPGQTPTGGAGGSGGSAMPPGGGNAGGALPPGPGTALSTMVHKPTDYFADPTDTMADMTQVRFGMSGRLGASPVRTMRETASVYAQDWLSRKGGAPAPDAASSWVTRNTRRTLAIVNRESAQHITQYMESRGISTMARFSETERFHQMVGAAMMDPTNSLANIPAEVKAVADVHRRIYAEMRDMAERHGVPGFENIPKDPAYFPRMWNVGAVYREVDKWGAGNLTSLFEDGMVRGGWDQARAKKVAPGFLTAIRSLGQHSDLAKSGMGGANPAALRAMLKQYVANITDQEIDDLVAAMTPDLATTPRAMRRVDLDPTTSISRVNAQGQTETLYIHQLYENNAHAVMEKYVRQINGAAAESEILRAMSLRIDPTGQTNLRTWDELRQRIADEHMTANIRTDTGKGLRDMQRLDTLRKSVVGIPLSETNWFNDSLRLARAFNFIRTGAGFTVAQLNEFGKIMGEFGTLESLAKIPSVRHFFRRGQAGNLDNTALDELETFVGVGTERMSHQLSARFDDIGDAGIVGSRASDIARRGEQFVGDVSLISGITTWQQRTVGELAGNTMLRWALGARTPSAARLADIGLDQAMFARISAQAKKYAISEVGMFGRKVKRWNIDAWDDVEAGAKLIQSLDRWSRKVIQDSDLGAISRMMTTPIGRMILQFRQYATQAWEKQFLRGVQLRDRKTFLSWFYSGAIGSLTYMGMKYANAIGDKEKTKALKKDLSPGRVALQGFARSGASSLLPTFVDTAAVWSGNGAVFNNRYSSLDPDILFGNPTVDLGKQVMKASQIPMAPFRGGVTRAEVSAADRLLPINGLLGIRQGLNALERQFPEKRKKASDW